MKKFFFIIFVLGLVVTISAGVVFYLFSQTPSGQTTKELHIPRGTTLNQIIRTLEKEEVIGHANLFRAYLMIQGIAHRVRAGDYLFEPNLTPKQVAHQLMEGDFKTYRFTIPEGYSLVQIADSLERQKIIDAASFKVALDDTTLKTELGFADRSFEGYLFPSTYETYHVKSADQVIRQMVQATKDVWTDELQEQAKKIGLTQHQVMTLASIVEKETGQAHERPLIASVFHNRLKKGMPLETDPTVIYGIKNFDGNLTRRHLETYTPYNTYRIPGLPPGPIASPGKAAILAVLYPAESDYIFFVSKNDGTHAFSKTLAEHNKYVYQYQIKRQQ